MLSPKENSNINIRPKSASNIGAKRAPGGFFRKSILEKPDTKIQSSPKNTK
jgi:hypothetical protein